LRRNREKLTEREVFLLTLLIESHFPKTPESREVIENLRSALTKQPELTGSSPLGRYLDRLDQFQNRLHKDYVNEFISPLGGGGGSGAAVAGDSNSCLAHCVAQWEADKALALHESDPATRALKLGVAYTNYCDCCTNC
jgi:hypothetical protein